MTIRDTEQNPREKEEEWFFRIKPILSLIRANFIRMWRPGSHLAVDEAMIPFIGRSFYTVKMKNKPIK
jgi:hypothetical protein